MNLHFKWLRNSAIALVIAAFSFACDSNSEFIVDGDLKYKIIEAGVGDSISEGKYLIYHIDYTSEDSTIKFTSKQFLQPISEQCRLNAWDSRGLYYQALQKLKGGDSAVFIIPAGDFITNTAGQTKLPDNITEDSPITFYIRVEDVLEQENYLAWRGEQTKKAEAKRIAESKAQIEKESAVIEKYLSENNIEAETTESGLRYVIHTKGSGARAQANQKVRVNYTGKLLDGSIFDSSVEVDAKAGDVYNPSRTYEPFEFLLGRRQVILGWDEGIALLDEGDKATLYIPSPLAYGARGSGARIPPNSILIFDVELVSIVE